MDCYYNDREFCAGTPVGIDVDGGLDGAGRAAHWDCVILECHEDWSGRDLEEMGLSRPPS